MSHDQPQAWRTVTIEDLGQVVTGRTPPSSKPEMFGSEYPFITPSDMSFGLRRVTTERSISLIGSLALGRIKLPPKSVAFVCIGATIGKVCLTSEDSFTNQQINSIVVDCDRHSPEFVYYLMLGMVDKVKALAGGAATPIVNKSSFCGISVSIPPIEIQSKIAFTLSAYDDLIENNTRRIEILEEMARRLYEEWFVQFRFPGHEGVEFKESELGPIPECWSVKCLGEVADLKWGDTKTTKQSYLEHGYVAYSAAGADGFLDYYDFDRPGVVLSAIGANCGATWFAKGKWSCIKNTIRFWSKEDGVSEEYLYLATYGSEFWPKRGSAQPFISQEDARSCKLLAPPKALGYVFSKLVGPLFEMANSLSEANKNLRRQRDTILPKLISGEIDVSDIPMPT
ncbi:TPA: restriction endonuclease subunit S [Pseudomonas aeruginosa]|uniref:restriction endonuclease subunit S n=1 Tax=Pseudomonas aeruginosa TaxID=287 RepID=UPI000FF3EF8B|nr:restriction endonuclease subunit S [Pseudomonas aeruginosa]MBH4356963.1 restriction endonuclease subunit S [Pseudomonas aeruginosa]MDI4074362.1 restriction endonuclease subunit S [Pseudomonas aeruginosa]RPX39673.1 hypothetical protein IPC725_13555 [Pseudomonas aeruginosa]WCV82852.1 restriction endonuclease subunit S [Pseudomonas aeruginosa]HDR3118824.1 restriction endonuclease subunit S [Pseudomonas aeruginosa]